MTSMIDLYPPYHEKEIMQLSMKYVDILQEINLSMKKVIFNNVWDPDKKTREDQHPTPEEHIMYSEKQLQGGLIMIIIDILYVIMNWESSVYSLKLVIIRHILIVMQSIEIRQLIILLSWTLECRAKFTIVIMSRNINVGSLIGILYPVIQ